ncbi:MAG TPA: helix-turn-helix domain-containing protein [Kribbella sp.]|jgi:AcrR family transcriptional regulator
MTQRRKAGDRRVEIQRVALALFTSGGYEATSMREIAEQLDITKAALYYHFDSKEAIVRSLFEERLANLDALIEWAEDQPNSPDRSARIAEGWFDLVVDGGLSFARFALANHAALRDLTPDRGGALDRMQKISALLTEPDASPVERLRVRMAMMTVNLAVMGAQGLELTDAEIIAAAAETASLIAPGFSHVITTRSPAE